MKGTDEQINPDDLIFGSIEHYKYFVSEYERLKKTGRKRSGEFGG